MTQEELAAIRLIVHEELKALFDYIRELENRIARSEADAIAREKNRVRQQRYRDRNVTRNVTHESNVTLNGHNVTPSTNVTLRPNGVTRNVTPPLSPPSPLSPPHTPPHTPHLSLSPKQFPKQFVTRDKVDEILENKHWNGSEFRDFIWGKLMGGKNYGTPIDNREDLKAAIVSLANEWDKTPR